MVAGGVVTRRGGRAGILRVTLTPIVQDVPFVGGVSLSWLEMPMVDFDVRGLGGADLMSMPAVADWIMTSLVQGYIANMVPPSPPFPSMLCAAAASAAPSLLLRSRVCGRGSKITSRAYPKSLI